MTALLPPTGGTGHCIAKGVDVKAMMGEIRGKSSGACKGKGGSMHIADLSKGMMGANGILGAGAPLACGAALAAKRRGDGGVAISFVGDGASNQGMFLESLNLAAVWNLPVVFVVENNGYAESTVDGVGGRMRQLRGPGLRIRDAGGHRGRHRLLRRPRGGGGGHRPRPRGGGPSLLECKMYRFFGHFEGDAQTYRGEGEVENLREHHDCIKIFRAAVTGAGAVDTADLDTIDAEALALVNEAVEHASAAPMPGPEDLETDVYISYG